MNPEIYIHQFLKSKGIDTSAKNKILIDEFCGNLEIRNIAKSILDNQNMIVEKYRIANRIFDIQNLPITLPNAMVGRQYNAKIDFKSLNLEDVTYEKFEGLDEVGLIFNKIDDSIEGVPIKGGDIKIKYLFKISGESDSAPLNEKIISLVINPNPKHLWKSIPSNQDALFAKPDDVSTFDKLGDKNIVVASKRGRSHANVGTARDDDFAYKQLEKTGWSLVVVSDGAGSATLARKGSEIACNSVIDYFENHIEEGKIKEFEEKIALYKDEKSDDVLQEINILSKQMLYKATVFVHTKIKEFADHTFLNHAELYNNPKAKSNIDYYHATLIFVLFKKYDFGYVFQSFSVGDCPIALMDKDKVEVNLLNWLDVGEHGGGTRFITQADIFHSKERPMSTRFNLKIIDDFSYLFLMTDGVYDAKFVVEANLEKKEKWMEFLADLDGNNEDNYMVRFQENNSSVANELSKWMDFWSVGNHDDRTLAVVF